MRTRAALIYTLLTAGIGLLLVVGCATAPASSSATSQEDLMAQAGFTLRIADTPKRLAYLSALPPGKVVQQNYKGRTHYVVCPGTSTNQCYVGDEAAYQRYQQLSLQQNISAERRAVSEQRWDPEYWSLYAASQGAGR
jgi:hypothetical protein